MRSAGSKHFDLAQFRGKKVLLLCHDNADLDSFCSAAIFQRVLKRNKIRSLIGVPSHINEQALNFALKEKISFQKNPCLDCFEVIFLFDFNDFEQLGFIRKEFESFLKKKHFRVIAFDHHVVEKRSIDSSGLGIGKAFSTTQLIFKEFQSFFGKKDFFYAALGMLEDTGHFLVGDTELFSDFALCLNKSGREFVRILAFTRNVVGRAERIAFLKAAQRAEIIEVGRFVVVTSSLSFYQGQAAAKLLDFGADVALVCGDASDNGFSVLSCRADSVFKSENKFNLVRDLLVPLQQRLGGEIGGHSGAAQWKGNAERILILQEAVSILKQRLKE
jgi:nanoRNase/pAp phosphatase (c-di-AMP/oligoRNAs hydrolase)